MELYSSSVTTISLNVLVRGIRSFADLEYELQMAHINKELSDEIETVILATTPKYSFISSSLVREALKFGGNISNFVPQNVMDMIKNR